MLPWGAMALRGVGLGAGSYAVPFLSLPGGPRTAGSGVLRSAITQKHHITVTCIIIVLNI